MTKILDPKECLRRFIEGKIQHNRDLHEAGLKNLYFEWKDYGNDILNQAQLLERYVSECGELRMANEILKKDIERLSHYKEDCKQIEKTFKALEIIKEKVMPLVCISDGFVYDGELFHKIEISEEDSILLKEVLSNERN